MFNVGKKAASWFAGLSFAGRRKAEPTPPPAVVEFCAPRPAYGTGPTERDAAYGSDPLPELVTPRPRVPHACYDANCDCAWNELGDEWPEEEKTVADRHTQDFEINER